MPPNAATRPDLRPYGWLLVLLSAWAPGLGTADAPAPTPAPAYVRITLHAVSPSAPATLAVSAYPQADECSFQGIVDRGAVWHVLAWGWHQPLPWGQSSKARSFRPGDTSGWLPAEPLIAPGRRWQTVLVFAWHQDLPNRAAPARKDDGNVDGCDATVEFASAPRGDAVFARVRVRESFPNVVLYLSKLDRPQREWSVRSMTDYARDRGDAYLRLGAAVFPAASQGAVRVGGGALEGYHASFYSPEARAAEARCLALLGVNRRTVTVPGPSDGGIDPWSESLEIDLRSKARALASSWPEEGELLVKMGDEPSLPTVAQLRQSAAGRAAFVHWLRARRSASSAPDAKSDRADEPIERGAVASRDDALRYFETVCFLQESGANLHAAYSRALHGADADAGRRRSLKTFTDAYWAGFEMTPDYLYEARFAAADLQGHHFGSGDTIGPRQTHADVLIADVLRSASERYGIGAGLLWFPCRINQREGTMLSGLTALGAGLLHFHIYGYGPMSTGWEWFSDDRFKTGAFVAASDVMRLAARYEPYWACQPPRARTAVLLSRSGSVWSRPSRNDFVDASGYDDARARWKDDPKRWSARPAGRFGWDCELRMTQVALRSASIPSDVVGEEEVSADALSGGNYGVLYVVSPHLALGARGPLESWVRRGGVVYLGALAATRDEADAPADWSSQITEGALTARLVATEPGEGAYHEGQVGDLRVLGRLAGPGAGGVALGAMERIEVAQGVEARTLATYADGDPALVAVRVGAGWIVRSGVCVGAALARGAQPGFDAVRADVPEIPVTRNDAFSGHGAYFRRDFEPRLHELLLSPTRLAGVESPVASSAGMVDARLFERPDGKGALVLVLNRGTQSNSKVALRVHLARRYAAVRNAAGASVAVSWDGSTASVTTPLDDWTFVEFRDPQRPSDGGR